MIFLPFSHEIKNNLTHARNNTGSRTTDIIIHGYWSSIGWTDERNVRGPPSFKWGLILLFLLKKLCHMRHLSTHPRAGRWWPKIISSPSSLGCSPNIWAPREISWRYATCSLTCLDTFWALSYVLMEALSSSGAANGDYSFFLRLKREGFAAAPVYIPQLFTEPAVKSSALDDDHHLPTPEGNCVGIAAKPSLLRRRKKE